MISLEIPAARELAKGCMVAVGHSPAEAEIIADHLIDCDLRGLPFGGLARALSIAERISTTATPRRPITATRQTPVSALVDGGDQVGYLVAQRATELALEMARRTGLAAVGARDTWYTGMFSYYLEQVTDAGCVGMAAANAPQMVAPHGGSEARFGTNPIAFGFPSTGIPVILDIGTSSVMHSDVVLKLRLGEKLAAGLAFDRSGSPTQDPAAALEGAFSVWGGHKGSGLAMVVHLLGIMCGAAADPEGLRECGFFLLVVDPALFGAGDDFKRQVAAYADSIKTSRPLDPGQPLRVPFERSHAERQKTIASNMISVPDHIYQALVQLSG